MSFTFIDLFVILNYFLPSRSPLLFNSLALLPKFIKVTYEVVVIEIGLLFRVYVSDVQTRIKSLLVSEEFVWREDFWSEDV